MTNHATVGGILSIVSGVIGIVGAFWSTFMIYFYQAFFNSAYTFPTQEEELGLKVISYSLGVSAVFLVIFGILAIVGGVFTLRRKTWGMALTGAIAASMVFFPCGIAAVIFVALGKPEFNAPAPPAPQATSSFPPAASLPHRYKPSPGSCHA